LLEDWDGGGWSLNDCPSMRSKKVDFIGCGQC
jgi:hypothetical protein